MMPLSATWRTASILSALVVVTLLPPAQALAQSATSAPAVSQQTSDMLKYVVIVSRHGVRSPTGKTDTLNQYSAKPWPQWTVPPAGEFSFSGNQVTLAGSLEHGGAISLEIGLHPLQRRRRRIQPRELLVDLIYDAVLLFGGSQRQVQTAEKRCRDAKLSCRALHHHPSVPPDVSLQKKVK